MKFLFLHIAFLVLLSCNTNKSSVVNNDAPIDSLFNQFVTRFMDAYWKQNPSLSIYAGYGKYYDILKIPDSASFATDVTFSKQYKDLLHTFSFDALSASNKTDYLILENQFNSAIWYIDTFKQQEWDPSLNNIGGECYEIITKNYAPLAERLKTLSAHIANADLYYTAALHILYHPTKEHTNLAIQQNEGSLEIFGRILQDSVRTATLTQTEKDTLLQRAARVQTAIRSYTAALKKILDDKHAVFRSFRIGDTLFNQKFRYDIVTDYSAREIFDKAVSTKKTYHDEMLSITKKLWTKYFPGKQMPADTLQSIKMMIDKIALNHAEPEHLVDTLTKQVNDLKRFIIEKNLFAYDTSTPLQVRITPAFMGSTTIASASISGGPYDKESTAFYNIMDLTKIPKDVAESDLREANHYALQILTIHEAMPGHDLQGWYSNKSKSIVKSVFFNGAMVEGWAVYAERLMLDNGWANNEPEMWLIFYKWSLRGCCNVITDYGIHCLNYSKEDIVNMLKNEAFQEDAQVAEKYKRATLSQVQLCSYFTGVTEINALREAYKKKMGNSYNLKDFHETFLSYGNAPVKYISALMIEN